MSSTRSTSSASTVVPSQIITKFAYPTGTPCEKPTELSLFALKGEKDDSGGMLIHFLALISDCAYHYEVDDAFHDGDMKMAYLTMKHAWEHNDAKPFLTLAMRNRRVLDWTNVMLIWAFVKPDNNKFWKDLLKDQLPMPPARRAQINAMLTAIRKFRTEWKELHEAGRITDICVGYGMDGWSVQLFGK